MASSIHLVNLLTLKDTYEIGLLINILLLLIMLDLKFFNVVIFKKSLHFSGLEGHKNNDHDDDTHCLLPAAALSSSESLSVQLGWMHGRVGPNGLPVLTVLHPSGLLGWLTERP